MATAAKSQKKEAKKITKQYIINQLEENEVDLSMSQLDNVPVKELALVTKGTRLDVSRNHLKTLPDNFGLLHHLVGIDLSSNQLQSLPNSFGKLVLLQKLDLYSNQLTRLPLTFCQLKKLTWLDLKNNPLEAGLAEAAGTCVSPKECHLCATRVLAYVKSQQSKTERERQSELEKAREEERQRNEEERKKKEALKGEKERMRRLKREELERNREKEMARQDAILKAKDMTSHGDEDEDGEPRFLTGGGGGGGGGGWSRVGCVCTSMILTTVVIMVILMLGISLCNYVMDTSSCQVLRISLIKSIGGFLDLLGLTD